MGKNLASTPFETLLPDSISGDASILAAAQALDGELSAVNVLIDQVLIWSRLDFLEGDILDLLGLQLAVDEWDPDWNDATKRQVIKTALSIHRHRGTNWAVQESCNRLGYGIEIIPRYQAVAAWAESGGATLDGRQLSGWPLVSWNSVTGVPYLSHWAEFGVRIDLASAVRPGWNEEIRRAVDVAKPVRSWPVFCYMLALILNIDVAAISSLAMRKQIDVDYPWCNLRLDGGWTVGTDDTFPVLSGNPLDGSWRIGQATPGTSMAVIRQCNILSRTTVTKAIVRPDQNILCRLGERFLRLDGSWNVGHNRVLVLGSGRFHSSMAAVLTPDAATAYAATVEMTYPATPAQLARRPRLHHQEKLDGGWRVGAPRPPVRRRLDGSWAIHRTGIGATSSAACRLDGQCTASLHKLAIPRERIGRGWARRLDGTWPVGARFDLDGSWKLARGHYLGAPRVGIAHPVLNGTWTLGYTCRLDGEWAVGQAGPACDVTIKSYNT